MKKIDSLLQKAALFEKLAVYGDRGSFLRAFAQESQTLEQAQEAGGGWSNRPRPGIPAPDPEAFGPSMDGGSSPLDYGSSPGSNIKDFPAKSAPATNTGPSVTKIQNNLNYVLFGDPNNRLMPTPIKNDGIFGDETKGAVRLFKEKFPRATSLNGPALYNYLNQLAESIHEAEAMKKQQQAQLATGPSVKT
jgi:hypothetical protein